MPGRGFTPAWWCRGAHAQTIWGAIGRPGPRLPVRRVRWELPDGDFLDVDALSAPPNAPALVILHGLESSSRSAQVVALLRAAHRQGWAGIAMNFRSCSGTLNRLRRIYTGGDTGDLAWVLERAAAEHPGAPLFCAGFSLGGNVLLKYLGEQGAQAPVRAAAAISVPFDLAVSVRCIERGFSAFYGRRLAGMLSRKALQKLDTFPDLADRAALQACRTVAEFDELVTAPVHGFPSAEAYWAASSSGQFLSRIGRPTLLINAEDDPFFPGAALPRQIAAQNPCLTAEFVPSGGHMGFVSGGWPGTLWSVDRAVDFMRCHTTISPSKT